MSKSKQSLPFGIHTVDYSSIVWFHDENTRQDSFGLPLADVAWIPDKDASMDKLIELHRKQFGKTSESKGALSWLLEGGYDPSQGVLKVSTLENAAAIREISVAELVKQAIAERKRQIAIWEANEATKIVANVAKRVWFNGAKPVEILGIGNEGYRRSEGIMGAICRREIAGKGIEYPMPVNCVEFSSKLERICSNIAENDKESGRSLYSLLDFLRQAAMIVQAYGTEADLMRANKSLSRGTAQKVFAVANLDKRFPDLRIVERCFLPAPKDGTVFNYTPDGYIPLSKLDKENVRKLTKGENPDNGETMAVEATDVHEFLERWTTGKIGGTKSMSAKEVAELANSPVELLRLFAAAYKGKQKGVFEYLDKRHADVNAAMKPFVKGLARLGFKTPGVKDEESEVEAKSSK